MSSWLSTLGATFTYVAEAKKNTIIYTFYTNHPNAQNPKQRRDLKLDLQLDLACHGDPMNQAKKISTSKSSLTDT